MLAVVGTWLDVSRQVPDLTITSWWRSEAKNAATPGSAQFSQHLVGCAMDGTSSVGQQRLFALASAAAARHGTRALISERGAVHVQGLPYGAVRAIVEREPELLRA